MCLLKGNALFTSLAVAVSSTVPNRIAGSWASTTGVCVQLGPDINYVAVDDIEVAYNTLATRPPTTTTGPTTTSERFWLLLFLALQFELIYYVLAHSFARTKNGSLTSSPNHFVLKPLFLQQFC